MNISWFDTSSENYSMLDTEDLTSINTGLVAFASTESTVTKNIWLVNTGNEEGVSSTIYDCGFWIDSDSLESLSKILNLGGLVDEDGYAYGLYLVFGYTNDGGDTTWLKKFDAAFQGGPGTAVTQGEASQFHFNWNQGTSILNKISMKAVEAYTYNGADGYTLRTTLYKNNDYLNLNYEGRGVLKVTLYLRTPENAEVGISDIRLNFHGVEELA